MGQYYRIVNVKKRQYINPSVFGDGSKLMEFSMSANGVLAGLAILLADGNGRGSGDLNSQNPVVGSWAGDNIVIAGDYADEGKFLPADKQSLTLYNVACTIGEDISLKVLDALCDDRYFFDEFRKDKLSWSSNDAVKTLIAHKMKKNGLVEPKEWRVPSARNPAQFYTVVNDNDEWSCTCPAFAYNAGVDCKHIKQCKP